MSPDDAADILQETALRALSRTEDFDGVEGLRRWAYVVARHLTIEQVRRRRAALVAEVPDAPAAGMDVAATVENRLVAEAVVSALLTLSSGDQHAITAAFRPAEQPATRKEYIRSAVRRHRARQRLMALCEGLLGIGAWVWRRLGQPATQVAFIVVPVCFGLLVWGGRSLRPAELGPSTPPAARAADVRSPVGTAPPASRIAAPGPARPASASPPAARPSADPTPPIPPAEVRIPGVNRDGAVGARPKQPGDHFVCAGTVVEGMVCVDSPPLPPPIGP